MQKNQAVFEKFLILNASGVHCTAKEELEEVLRSSADAVILKTITLKPREGNPQPRLFYAKDFSLNSMGLPNRGVDYYCKILPELKRKGKPIFASLAASSEEEYYKIFDKVEKADFDALEVNLSCPNVEASCVFAYDLDLTLRIAEKLRKETSKPLGFKLPPYPERWPIRKLAQGFLEIGIDFVTLSNSWPLGCVVDWKKESLVIKPNQGIGGLGGKFFKYIVLGQVRFFYQVFKGKVKIIAVGGVASGKDVYEYALAGANAAGIGSALLYEGVGIFERIKEELEEVLKGKGMKVLEEKIGKLREI